MIHGLRELPPSCVDRRISRGQFAEQMLPLVEHLAPRHDDARDRTARSDLAAVEVVTPLDRLFVNRTQVRVDRRARRSVRREARELRMMPIASRLATQYGAREQRLSPERNEPLAVEVLRVERPEAHICGDRAGSLV